MKKAELVFVPAPAIGHLPSAIQFANQLLDHDYRISITICVIKTPFTPFIDSYINSLTSSNPRIQLVHLPHLANPPPPELNTRCPSKYLCDYVKNSTTHFKEVIKNLIFSRSSSSDGPVQVAGVVLDFFCGSLIDPATELGLPSYIFSTSNAGYLSFLLSLPDRHDRISTEFRISDSEQLIPGFVNPVTPRVFPAAVFDKEGGYTNYVEVGRKLRDAKGIIVNTFADLEPYALQSFYNDPKTPPVYPVGPVLSLKKHPNSDLDQPQMGKIEKWLDEQPEASVVFLCFGSRGTFNQSQAKEIAFGLEGCGFKFLWSLRVSKSSIYFENPLAMLPEGFLDRIVGRGMVCGWTAQVEVLTHKAIGAFVSHCGWNSILESLWYGVPVVAWPLYAEQHLNALEMIKELGLAVELRVDYRAEYGDLVVAEEIEKAVRCVMEGDCEVRKKVKEMGEKGKKAVMDGGSSFSSSAQLIRDILGRK